MRSMWAPSGVEPIGPCVSTEIPGPVSKRLRAEMDPIHVVVVLRQSAA
uniref:Uncharacterized protein n=1 Tax=Parascaris equorum TaxID=6256 RepID=A0A914S941_PAREQ